MKTAVESMLSHYDCKSEKDYTNALKEIFQEIALLGLWRSKFFEKAAFYGGTALRILYGLDRFSEDVDFTLLNKDENFSLHKYNEAIKNELNAFGFEVEVTSREKNTVTQIESAFIKANTLSQMINIQVPDSITTHIHKMNSIKIKMEVDTHPPGEFTTEVRKLLLPIPFTVLTLCKEDLFSGKMHALLFRKWKNRVKGRDWYDFYWYVSRKIPINLIHLKARMVQSGAWDVNNNLTHQDLLELLTQKIETIDFEAAKSDVLNFLRNDDALHLWSKDFFIEISKLLKTTSPIKDKLDF